MIHRRKTCPTCKRRSCAWWRKLGRLKFAGGELAKLATDLHPWRNGQPWPRVKLRRAVQWTRGDGWIRKKKRSGRKKPAQTSASQEARVV